MYSNFFIFGCVGLRLFLCGPSRLGPYGGCLSMMKFRDGARLPLFAALPVFLFLILLSASPKHAFSREAPPIFREETDGGGDEWNDMASVAPTLGQPVHSQTCPASGQLTEDRDYHWFLRLVLSRLSPVGRALCILPPNEGGGSQWETGALDRITCK
jgi:hypothetical protein